MKLLIPVRDAAILIRLVSFGDVPSEKRIFTLFKSAKTLWWYHNRSGDFWPQVRFRLIFSSGSRHCQLKFSLGSGGGSIKTRCIRLRRLRNSNVILFSLQSAYRRSPKHSLIHNSKSSSPKVRIVFTTGDLDDIEIGLSPCLHLRCKCYTI